MMMSRFKGAFNYETTESIIYVLQEYNKIYNDIEGRAFDWRKIEPEIKLRLEQLIEYLYRHGVLLNRQRKPQVRTLDASAVSLYDFNEFMTDVEENNHCYVMAGFSANEVPWVEINIDGLIKTILKREF